jgi:ketosteroid isomerase-like protein
MKNLNVRIGDAVVTVAEAGDLAAVKAPYHTMFTDARGQKVEVHGTSIAVFKKTGGQWKFCMTRTSARSRHRNGEPRLLASRPSATMCSDVNVLL